jgi:hypothetical protein
VAINGAAENAFVQANFTGRVWIGLSDEIVEGTFLWDSGEPLTYTNWCAGEPNNANGTEHYVEMLTGSGCWNDQPANGNNLVPAGVIELPFGPRYQGNSLAAGADFDGVQATLLAPAASTPCAGTTVTATVASTLLGAPYDIAISAAPPVPAGSPGSLTTPGGQIINLDLTQPFLFVIGGLAPLSIPFPGSFSLPLTAPPAGTVTTAQMLIVDGTQVDGFSLSQAASLQPAAPGASVAGPTGDDTSVVVDLLAAPFCGATLPFYGTSYSQIYVISNGRITMNGPDTGFSPTVAAALTGNPFLGAWTDLNPAAGGTITAVNTGTGLRVDYQNVVYYNTAVPNTFSVGIDGVTGEVTLSGLSGIGVGPGSMFLGISRGNTGATDPGMTNFTNGVGITGGPNEMIYEFGGAGTLAPGISSIQFFPNGAGNYDWIAL